MSVTNAKDICSHTAASTGIDEVLHSLRRKKVIGRNALKWVLD